MKKKLLIIFFLLFLLGCYHPTQKVIQGRCVSYDDAKKIIYIDDELTPEIENIPIDVSTAKIGTSPSSNHWLRISFKKEGNKFIAFKVMNLTGQKELLSDVGIEVTKEGVKKKY